MSRPSPTSVAQQKRAASPGCRRLPQQVEASRTNILNRCGLDRAAKAAASAATSRSSLLFDICRNMGTSPPARHGSDASPAAAGEDRLHGLRAVEAAVLDEDPAGVDAGDRAARDEDAGDVR